VDGHVACETDVDAHGPVFVLPDIGTMATGDRQIIFIAMVPP
jgi:hypothetical protein